jgi:hypothetical protein
MAIAVLLSKFKRNGRKGAVEAFSAAISMRVLMMIGWINEVDRFRSYFRLITILLCQYHHRGACRFH